MERYSEETMFKTFCALQVGHFKNTTVILEDLCLFSIDSEDEVIVKT